MNAVLICNPKAARFREAALRASAYVLELGGWSVIVERTRGPHDATEIAARAVQNGVDAVLVAGGDGTLNEAIQALVGTDVPLGFLPMGTVNVWARETRIPRRGTGAARVILEGRTELVDVGNANDRYFLLMAGIGFDGVVLARAQKLERHKSKTGILPYVAAGVWTAPMFRGIDLELRYEEVIRRVRTLVVVMGNTRLYGNRFHFTPDATANDGLLDVAIVKGSNFIDLARQAGPLLLKGTVGTRDVEHLRIRSFEIRGDQPVPYQLDGELCGTTPLRIAVEHKALKIFIPSETPDGLIERVQYVR